MTGVACEGWPHRMHNIAARWQQTVHTSGTPMWQCTMTGWPQAVADRLVANAIPAAGSAKQSSAAPRQRQPGRRDKHYSCRMGGMQLAALRNNTKGSTAMKLSTSWESIDVHLLQILRALLSECSVSSAARKLNLSQPAVSTALRRLRDITGDPLLVRSRNGMTPTERGMALLEPVKIALAQIEAIGLQQVRFDPMKTRRVFNIATPDYLNAILIGNIVAHLRQHAPNAQVVLHSFGPEFHYAKALESGALDTVIR